MRKEFQVHVLNETGNVNVRFVAEVFSTTLDSLSIVCPDSREFSICKAR